MSGPQQTFNETFVEECQRFVDHDKPNTPSPVEKSILFIDTETTGMAQHKLPPTHPSQPRLVQLAAILCDPNRKIVARFQSLIRPDGWVIEPGAQAVHGISAEDCQKYGISLGEAIGSLESMAFNADIAAAHNYAFDSLIIEGECARTSFDYMFRDMENACTMLMAKPLLKLPGRYGDYKWPRLDETYRYLFGRDFSGAHDAMVDVTACMECYYEMEDRAK